MIVFHKPVEYRDRFVVVLPRDGIEFVVVAARAVYRKSLKALVGGSDDVVQVVVPVVWILQVAVENARAQANEAGGGHRAWRRRSGL
jgi:uncharacterized integral membrane protein